MYSQSSHRFQIPYGTLDLTLARFVPPNDQLINRADKWCGEIQGCMHGGFGEHIKLIAAEV